MIRWLTGLAALLAAAQASAAPDLARLDGVWSGTIGTLPVRVCFDGNGGAPDGKYYYLKRLSTLPLEPDDKRPSEMTEGWADTKDVARWKMAEIDKDAAQGVWAAKGRTLPIRLARLPFTADKDNSSACASDAFIQPIVAATKILKRSTTDHGLAVDHWSLAYPDDSITVETVQLRGTSAAVAAINRKLREPFDKPEEGWKWCLRNAGAWGAGYSDAVTVRMVTKRLLQVNFFNESECGGAHPNNSNQPVLFDRATGKQADLFDWLAAGNVNREKVEGYEETIDTLRGKLFDLVIKLHPRSSANDAECGDAVDTASSWSLELKPDGIGFTPDLPRVVMACGDEQLMTWKQLEPFLSPLGKREVAALRAELKR